MAYNRDEAEVFSLEKALQAGYSEINTTAPDVLDRKMREIDKYIKEKAEEKARGIVERTISEKERKVIDREENMSELILEMAKSIILENENYIGSDVVEEAMKELEKEEAKEKKGGKKDGNKISKTSKGRSSTRRI